ncbi:MAG: AAA family ATPase [Rubrobacteraceae bacterium]
MDGGSALRGEEVGMSGPPQKFVDAIKKNGAGPFVPLGTRLSDVEPEQVEWLWQNRIPLGKITVLDGDPGNGKSALTTDLAARLSVGRTFPDGQPCDPAGVIIMNAEDGLADTIRPRLDAAQSDPSRVLSLATVPEGDEGDERHLTIPDDIPLIRQHVEHVGAKLVIIDPLMAFLSGKANAHVDQDIRRALAPLARMAELTGAAVLLVRHLNKSQGGSAIYRGGGSIGIIGAARSGLLVGVHPEDENKRVLAGQKSNLSPMPDSLAYRIVTAANGAARIEYEGVTEAKADTLLRTPADAEERSALGEAIQFLRDELKDGPVWAKSVNERARKLEISEASLRRAKGALSVQSSKEGDEGWSWNLPGKASRKVLK